MMGRPEKLVTRDHSHTRQPTEDHVAVSSFGTQHIGRGPFAGSAESLNTRWHKAALLGFLAVVLLHWAEHIVQAYQFFVLHLVYNLLVFVPMVLAMYEHMYPPARDTVKPMCTCADHRAPVGRRNEGAG